MLTWDEAKRQANIRKHGIDFQDCDVLFDFPVLVEEDMRDAYGEQRLNAIGFLRGLLVHLTYVDATDSLHVISLRRATKDEAKRYRKILSHD